MDELIITVGATILDGLQSVVPSSLSIRVSFEITSNVQSVRLTQASGQSR